MGERLWTFDKTFLHRSQKCILSLLYVFLFVCLFSKIFKAISLITETQGSPFLHSLTSVQVDPCVLDQRKICVQHFTSLRKPQLIKLPISIPWGWMKTAVLISNSRTASMALSHCSLSRLLQKECYTVEFIFPFSVLPAQLSCDDFMSTTYMETEMLSKKPFFGAIQSYMASNSGIHNFYKHQEILL